MTNQVERPREIQATKQSIAKKPASRWRNKWWSAEHILDERTGVIDPPGISWGHTTYPTKDIAETNAQRAITANVMRGKNFRYLGAFPDEGQSQ